MKIVLTGARGFLGWHTRLRLHALADHQVHPVGRDDWDRISEFLADADAIVHIAGVNRADSDIAVEMGNLSLAEDLAVSISSAAHPIRVVYANSTQAGNGSPYGIGKQRAAEVLRTATEASGGQFVDVLLPNIFGEHGRPQYNSFVATFVAAAIAGESPDVIDNEIELLHAQQAAQAIIDALSTNDLQMTPRGFRHGVLEIWQLLQEFHGTYMPRGEFPDLGTTFAVDLFNTYRAALFPAHYPVQLVPHTDRRGSFVETVRCRGGEGQTSFSSTAPGVTRGEHYHLRKIERFAVIAGTATIELRRMFTDNVVSFVVNGEAPVAIDMPTGWVHNITNTGDEMLFTQFWSHELFRPEAPDTFFETVRQSQGLSK